MAKRAKVLGWIAGFACIACCAGPLLATVGVASLGGIAAYLEWGAIGAALVVVVVALVVWRLRRKPAPTCSIDGPCNPN